MKEDYTNNIPDVGADGPTAEYTDENIRHSSDMAHVRTRPATYIGRLGEGSRRGEGG